MRFVELKSEAQLDMQTLHRARDRLVGERTALINQLRAVLLERGITVPQGRRKLERYLGPPQGAPRGRHPLRQDRLILRRHHRHRRVPRLDQVLAAVSIQMRTDPNVRTVSKNVYQVAPSVSAKMRRKTG